MAEERANGLRLNSSSHSASSTPVKRLSKSRPTLRTYGSEEAAYSTNYSELAATAFLPENLIEEPGTPPEEHERRRKDSRAALEASRAPGKSIENGKPVQRETSISFNKVVKVQDGDEQALEEPLVMKERRKSKPFDIPIRTRPRRHSEAETEDYDQYTGELLSQRSRNERQQYHEGEGRHPLLQTTVDELARDAAYHHLPTDHHVPSLTSEMTASPDGDVGTPITRNILSHVVTSPVDIANSPSNWSSKRAVNSRSFGSLGSVGRRHTLKSTGGSIPSPARSFLSQLHPSESLREPDPDEEGQEIGDDSGYIIGSQIGFGGFSVVKEVKTIENNKRVVRAVKIVRKLIKGKSDSENDQLQADFEREVGVWRYLKHRYILPLIAVYDTHFATFCITKLNSGGTLFDLVRARRRNKDEPVGLPSHLAKRYIYQLGSAIRYLHEDMRVVHRDIKPENCLLDMSEPDAEVNGGNVLLCDFGMADFIQNDNRSAPSSPARPTHNIHTHSNDSNSSVRNVGPGLTSTAVQGSLEYTAPEMVNNPTPLYSTAADIWAYGCVMYTLLTGDRPFYHEFQPRLMMTIATGDYDMELLHAAPAVKEDEQALDLVGGCLTMEPEKRFDVRQVLEHEWLEGCRAKYEPEEEEFS